MQEELQKLAHEATKNFAIQTRKDESKYFVLAEGAPAWLVEAVREAHDGMLPNDESYRIIRETLIIMSDLKDWNEQDEVMEALEASVDVYNNELLYWLSSHLQRSSYVDEAVDRWGYDTKNGLIQMLMLGQQVEREMVFNKLKAAMENQLANECEDVIRLTASNGRVCVGRITNRKDISDEPKPWMAESVVDDVPMAFAHFPTRLEAEAWAEKMTRCYAEAVHGKINE